jgi:hypothetical protein
MRAQALPAESGEEQGWEWASLSMTRRAVAKRDGVRRRVRAAARVSGRAEESNDGRATYEWQRGAAAGQRRRQWWCRVRVLPIRVLHQGCIREAEHADRLEATHLRSPDVGVVPSQAQPRRRRRCLQAAAGKGRGSAEARRCCGCSGPDMRRTRSEKRGEGGGWWWC